MGKGRLEAFSDGVLAIAITIMVLELKAPHGGADFADLLPQLPAFLSYVLSFLYVGIYWNNHHHLLQAAERVDGRAMWANLHLLFWLSLFPFVTHWMGANWRAPAPTALYGGVLLMAGLAYWLLQISLVRLHGVGSALHTAVGADPKAMASIGLYAAAIAAAFAATWVSHVLFFAVAALWMIPDRRIARALADQRRPR